MRSVGQPGDLALRKGLGRGETVLCVIGGSRQCGTCTLTCGVVTVVCVRVCARGRSRRSASRKRHKEILWCNQPHSTNNNQLYRGLFDSFTYEGA